MQQDATSPSRPGLSQKQETVLQGLLTGETVRQVAEDAGVDRTTVHRWLRGDDEFRAALNRARLELRREMDTQLEDLARKALRTVLAAVEDGDVRAGIAVLKGSGVLAGSLPGIGPRTAEEIGEERQVHEANRELFRAINRGMIRE